MPPPSPRRSSRARVPNAQSQQSSMSSGASGRHERSTRSLNKPPSDQSTPTASLSSEPPEELEDTLLSRRRRRAHDDDSERVSRANNSDTANASEDMQEDEDEAVRCLCASEDYPGRPPVDGPDAEFFNSVELTDDVTGFFVQCDICKVWQHGACVGIFSAESSPDEYFCEQCRKDLHNIHIANNGQKYSKYLPLYRNSRSVSRATSVQKDGSHSPKPTSRSSRAEAAHASKRRSTMNSRDAAYDDEQLRRAIEASKEQMPETDDTTARRAKRSRSESEENQTIVKRQRTGSRSPSPAEHVPLPASAEPSDNEAGPRNATRTSRNARSLRDRSEKEDKERQRQEFAVKRKGRAERRRAEDSDVSDDEAPATKHLVEKTVESVSVDQGETVTTPGTPPAPQFSATVSQKKPQKTTSKRGKGRGQYAKDQNLSPSRSMSRDIQRPADESSTNNPKSPPHEQKQGSKIKPSIANKMSLQDMKRRVAAIMDFISRTQLDLAAEAIDQSSSSSNSGVSTPKLPGREAGSTGEKNDDGSIHDGATATGDKDFKELSCVEMMDVLTRDMVKWQNQYE